MYRSVLSTNWQRHREKSGRDWDSPKLKPKPTPPSRNPRVQRSDVLNEIERKQVQTDSPELRDLKREIQAGPERDSNHVQGGQIANLIPFDLAAPHAIRFSQYCEPVLMRSIPPNQ